MTPHDVILHFVDSAPVVNLCVKSDANIFISDRYVAILRVTILSIWLRNAYSRPSGGGVWRFYCLRVVGYC